MTTTEYALLCSAHAFPRIDTDPVAAANELHLITLAREHGDAFKRFFNSHYHSAWGVPFFKFPVATTANEQHTNNDTMNLTLNITADPKILDAINNLTAAISSKQCGSTPADAPCPVEAIKVTEEGTVEEAPDTTEEPKKTRAKKTPTPKVVEPEPEPEVEAPTGAELAERISVLKGTPYTKQLRAYLDEQLGLAGVKLNEVTDATARNKINEKITELLEAAKAAADDL